jgi:hypothetical protein
MAQAYGEIPVGPDERKGGRPRTPGV